MPRLSWLSCSTPKSYYQTFPSATNLSAFRPQNLQVVFIYLTSNFEAKIAQLEDTAEIFQAGRAPAEAVGRVCRAAHAGTSAPAAARRQRGRSTSCEGPAQKPASLVAARRKNGVIGQNTWTAQGTAACSRAFDLLRLCKRSPWGHTHVVTAEERAVGSRKGRPQPPPGPSLAAGIPQKAPTGGRTRRCQPGGGHGSAPPGGSGFVLRMTEEARGEPMKSDLGF